MSLDALAPDQRAVVQLVLQQDRSYEDLAGLLGITPEAVRERAQRGMERLAPGEALDPADRAQISDYLLGQQSVSARESTRSLLADSQPARSWAQAISVELAGVARSPLPEVPTGPAATERTPDPEPEPEPIVAGDSDPILEDPVAPARARPRPRQRVQATTPPADFGFGEVTGGSSSAESSGDDPDREPARTSRLGGTLLITGLAVFVAALVIWLVSRDSDDPGSETATTGEATATATAGADGSNGRWGFQSAGVLPLAAVDGSDAAGQIEFFVSQQALAFNVIAENLEPRSEGAAYAIWLTGGKTDHFLGFGAVDESGGLEGSGPREETVAKLPKWLGTAKQMVISRETKKPGASPARPVLQGALADIAPPAAGTAPTPAP